GRPQRCRREAKRGRRWPQATRSASCSGAFRCSALVLAAPRRDPFLDLLVGNPLAAVERRDRLLDAGDLPLVDIEILVDRLGREKRAAAAGAPGELLQPLLRGLIDTNGEGCGSHVVDVPCCHVLTCIQYSTTGRRARSTGASFLCRAK